MAINPSRAVLTFVELRAAAYIGRTSTTSGT
jgi:hypothetical protein